MITFPRPRPFLKIRSDMSGEPMTGEIWEDAEGTLMVYLGDDEWAFFGTHAAIPSTHPYIIQPIRLAFDVFGNCVIETLRYPNGFCYGVPEGKRQQQEESDGN